MTDIFCICNSYSKGHMKAFVELEYVSDARKRVCVFDIFAYFKINFSHFCHSYLMVNSINVAKYRGERGV